MLPHGPPHRPLKDRLSSILPSGLQFTFLPSSHPHASSPAKYPWGSVGELPCQTHQPSPGVTPDPPPRNQASHPNELYSLWRPWMLASHARWLFVRSISRDLIDCGRTCVGCGCGCQTPPDPARKCLSNPCRAMTPMNGRPWKGGKGREFRYHTVSNPCESPYEG